EAAGRAPPPRTRPDNGQYEIALGPQVAGAAASPALAAMSEATDNPRSRGGRGGRGRGRGGRDREESPTAAEPPQTDEPVQNEEPDAPAAPAAEKSGFFGDAFGLIKQAVGRIGVNEEPTTQEEPEAPRPVLSAPTPDIEEEDDIPMPTSSAPPPPYSTPSTTPGGIPMRSARFRRGSRGGARRPGAGGVPEIPKIGVVEVDPNFRPRGDVLPPKAPPAPSSGPGPEREERGGRGGGRGGRGGRDRGPRAENGDRGERGGRGRRGGRGGRGRGPRRFESDADANTNDTRPGQS